jgi:hypothetical protein
MFEYGGAYGAVLIMILIASSADIILMAVNVFFRRDFLGNYAKHGISIFKLFICAFFIAYIVFVLAATEISQTMFTIHLICGALLGVDLVGGSVLKLKYRKKPANKA